MTTPLISIILPTRNRLATIKRTVERVQAQTFQDWELVISDNASEEAGKLEYLRDLAAREPRVRLHEQAVNIGIHKNWRFCIERIRGRYYIPVTDDDWWGEDDYLETLLAGHDGKTGSVFPNMCMHHPDTGEVKERALSKVYGGLEDRYRMYEGLVKDGKGAIMIGLIDTTVVPREEIIATIDNDLAVCIETVGMHRIARRYPLKFAEGVNYHHPEYSGNYSKAFDSAQRVQDTGIVYFQLLDEIRKAAREDAGYGGSLGLHWDLCRRYCLRLWRESDHHRDVTDRIERQRERIQSLQAELRKYPGNHSKEAASRPTASGARDQAGASDDTTELQDLGIVNFSMLDEVRKAARMDSGYNLEFLHQWNFCRRFCLRLWRRSSHHRDMMERLQRQREQLKAMHAELDAAYGHASLGSVLRAWWTRRRTLPSS
jgi:glycosyltransferase involved in cell wall biosynthesis